MEICFGHWIMELLYFWKVSENVRGQPQKK